MQEHKLPSVYGVDDEKMLRDVQRIVFDNTHSVAELLEEMGEFSMCSLQTPHRGTTKRVTVSEDVTVFPDVQIELLNLPPALSLLYYAAIVDATVKKTPNLLYILELLAEPEPSPARCEILYNEGVRQRKENAKWREEYQKALMEKNMKECTFKPAISDFAKELPPKGLATFMDKCVEWKKNVAMRLAKKVVQDRISRGEDELTKSWEMSKRSRQLLEKRKKKGKKRVKLWESKKLQHTSTLASSTTASAKAVLDGADAGARDDFDELEAPSFSPVTCALVNEKFALLKDGGDVGAMNTSQVSEVSNKNSKRLINACIERFETDIVRRKKNMERLRAQCVQIRENQLRERETGQPFFEPNAMPAVMKGGVYVSFEKLSKEEKLKCIKDMRSHNQEHVLARYFYLLRKEQKGTPQSRRNIDELVNDLVDQKRKSCKLLDEFCAEETFHPQITTLASKLKSKKSWKHIYERPLPKPALQLSPAESFGFTPKAKSSDACMQRVLARSDEWVERRSRRVGEYRREIERKATEGCTFRPQLNAGVDVSTVSGGSAHSRAVRKDALVANAEARVWNELGLLRLQAAQRDESFVGALRQSPSKLTLLSAPRLSRESVERYAQSLSIAGLSPQSHVKSHGNQWWRSGTATSKSIPITDFDDDSMRDSESGSLAYSGYDDYEENALVDEDDYITPNEVENFGDEWTTLDAQTDLILKNCRYY